MLLDINSGNVLYKYCMYLMWSYVNRAENYTRKMFDLLTFAYSTITVSDAAHFMGMSEEDATKCMLLLLFCTSNIE